MPIVGVLSGDTWEALASRYCVTVAELLEVNGFDPGAPPDPDPEATILIPSDAPETCVAPGHEHMVDTGGDATLWLRVDYTPDDAVADGGSFRLYSSDGLHDLTVPIADNFLSNGATVDVVFHEVDSSATYSIDYIDANDVAVTVVTETPFAQLQDETFSGGSDEPSDP